MILALHYHCVSSEVFRFQSTSQKLLSLGLGCLNPALRRAILFLDRGCVACSPGGKKSWSIQILSWSCACARWPERNWSVLSSFPKSLNDCPILASEILRGLLGVSVTLSLMLWYVEIVDSVGSVRVFVYMVYAWLRRCYGCCECQKSWVISNKLNATKGIQRRQPWCRPGCIWCWYILQKCVCRLVAKLWLMHKLTVSAQF